MSRYPRGYLSVSSVGTTTTARAHTLGWQAVSHNGDCREARLRGVALWLEVVDHSTPAPSPLGPSGTWGAEVDRPPKGAKGCDAQRLRLTTPPTLLPPPPPRTNTPPNRSS